MLEQVTVAGGGTLGSQIAFQSAFFWQTSDRL